MMPHQQLKGVFVDKGRRLQLATKALVPDPVYGEKFIRVGHDLYRIWDAKKSKLGAAIMKGISQIGIKPGSKVLYLGCSTGTTASHVSDIVGNDGFVYGLDFAPRVMRNFMFVVEKRKNMLPIFGDAKQPESYKKYVGDVDVVFQDVAQRDQVGIFLKNVDFFLKPGGFGLLTVKAKSIDVSKYPEVIFKEVKQILEKVVTIVDYRSLEPFERDHAMFVVKKK
ncbi:MAG: fibrillarin-like rRNA/tRNA 2'-O-methyltransferase [Nanoarchaeota archaeon]